MPVLPLILGIVGIVLLIFGAELLVRGSSRLAAAFGISPLVIGLTIVAFGTSSPELAVSVQAGLEGQGDIALGNVVGSNICNVLLILGVSALITPLTVAQQLVRIEVPLMIGVSVLLLVLALDGGIGRLDGLFLVAGIVAYTTFAIVQSRRESREVQAEYAQEYGKPPGRSRWAGSGNLLLAVLGLVLLVIGANWLVDGATILARAIGISELVIGLTVVAVGTSLPEVATSITAAIRGERDIAVGNVVGSNIFNILAVLGISGVVAPAGIGVAPAALSFDLPVMVAVAFACLPIFLTYHRIDRWEGALFLGFFVAYLLYLMLAAAEHDALAPFSGVMLAFVLPLTAVTLVISLVRFRRTHQSWGFRQGP